MFIPIQTLNLLSNIISEEIDYVRPHEVAARDKFTKIFGNHLLKGKRNKTKKPKMKKKEREKPKSKGNRFEIRIGDTQINISQGSIVKVETRNETSTTYNVYKQQDCKNCGKPFQNWPFDRPFPWN
ncbi:unnamed protein product [Pieris macdunnoughi]|uniref:Uncharacterized protein n=1 Tax=Pieris macdunnoughi TaxID=345717 RepID=A0A821KQV9_9NEOP|nr:unnamed protein product [Pieris macdunnoughi]